MRDMVSSGEADALVAERVWQELARGLMEKGRRDFSRRCALRRAGENPARSGRIVRRAAAGTTSSGNRLRHPHHAGGGRCGTT